MYIITYLTLFALLTMSHGFIAYDCGAQSANITTISLLSVKECNIQINKPIITEVHVKLLQLSRFRNVHVKLCRVALDRMVYNCGQGSHNSLVHNGYAGYLIDVSPEICSDMHMHLKYRHGDTLFVGLRHNDTVNKPAVIAGKVQSNGACEGKEFSDHYGSWSNVVAQGVFKITLEDYYAAVSVEDDMVYLRQGRHCPLSANKCLDSDGSNAYWSSTPSNECTFSEYDVLYEGPAQRIYDNSTLIENIEEIYSVQNGDIAFGLAKKGTEYVCEYQIARTDHPKLFIQEINKENVRHTKKPISVNNVDLLSYMNSKFIYVEKHFGKKLKNLYVDVLTQKCELERQVLENSLLIAYTKPAEFAMRLMKGRGYMASTAGEVIHIVKCLPVPVKTARLTTCYSHLPVIVNNATMFVSPHTHILLKRSPIVNCNAFIAHMYHIDNEWIKLSPLPTLAKDPMVLEPLTKPTWKYENLAKLATAGIYSLDDLEKLQDHLMFPEEQTAVLDALARTSMGEVINSPGFSFSNLIDENSIEKIANRATAKLWGWLTGFGTFSAGVIGIFMITKMVKFLIDTFIHGYALHRAFGWSIWLLGAVWDSLTNFLLHFKKKVFEEMPEDGRIETKIPDQPKASEPEGPPKAEASVANVYPSLDMQEPHSISYMNHVRK